MYYHLHQGGYIFIRVSLLVSRITLQIRSKVADGPWKKLLEFGGNPQHTTLGLRYG